MRETIRFLRENPFLPQPLRLEKTYWASLRSVKKKEIDLEFPSLNLSKDAAPEDLLRMPENRGWAYGGHPFIPSSSYSFLFKGFDRTTRSFLFSEKKNKLTALSSPFEKVRIKKERNYGKARFLSNPLRSYKFLMGGTLGKIQKKGKKVRGSSARHALVFFLSHVGLLRNMRRSVWEVAQRKILRKKRSLLFSKKLNAFLRKNRSFGSFFRLRARRKSTVHFLMAEKNSI